MSFKHSFFGIITIALESFLWEQPEASSASCDEGNLQQDSGPREFWKVASSGLLLIIVPPASFIST